MSGLRTDLIAALTRVYFSTDRKSSMAEDMADAVLAIIKKHGK